MCVCVCMCVSVSVRENGAESGVVSGDGMCVCV